MLAQEKEDRDQALIHAGDAVKDKPQIKDASRSIPTASLISMPEHNGRGFVDHTDTDPDHLRTFTETDVSNYVEKVLEDYTRLNETLVDEIFSSKYSVADDFRDKLEAQVSRVHRRQCRGLRAGTIDHEAGRLTPPLDKGVKRSDGSGIQILRGRLARMQQEQRSQQMTAAERGNGSIEACPDQAFSDSAPPWPSLHPDDTESGSDAERARQRDSTMATGTIRGGRTQRLPASVSHRPSGRIKRTKNFEQVYYGGRLSPGSLEDSRTWHDDAAKASFEWEVAGGPEPTDYNARTEQLNVIHASHALTRSESSVATVERPTQAEQSQYDRDYRPLNHKPAPASSSPRSYPLTFAGYDTVDLPATRPEYEAQELQPEHVELGESCIDESRLAWEDWDTPDSFAVRKTALGSWHGFEKHEYEEEAETDAPDLIEKYLREFTDIYTDPALISKQRPRGEIEK